MGGVGWGETVTGVVVGQQLAAMDGAAWRSAGAAVTGGGAIRQPT